MSERLFLGIFTNVNLDPARYEPRSAAYQADSIPMYNLTHFTIRFFNCYCTDFNHHFLETQSYVTAIKTCLLCNTLLPQKV